MNNVVSMLFWAFALRFAALGPVPQDHLPGNVRLTVEGIRIDYCDNDADLAMAAIHIRLRLTNRGKLRLILSRELGPDQELTVTNEAGAVVYSQHPSIYERRIVDFGAAPDAKWFEIVSQGTSTERDFVIGIPISKNPAHRIGSTPPPGDYIISAIRSSWPFYGDEARARKDRDRWRRYGLLLIAPIRVDRVRVQISLPKEMQGCVSQP